MEKLLGRNAVAAENMPADPLRSRHSIQASLLP